MQTKSKVKIKTQMYIIFIPFLVIPVAFIGLFLTLYFAKALYQQTYSQLESDNLRVKSILLDCTLNIFNMSEDFINDKALLSMLTEKAPEETEFSSRINTYDRFDTYMKNNTALAAITVYTTNTSLPESFYIKHATPQVKDEWFSKVSIPSSSAWVNYTPENKEKSLLQLTFIRSFPIVDSDEHTNDGAILVVTISTNYLKNRIQNNKLFTAVSLNKDEIFFSTTRSVQGEKQQVPIDFEEKYFTSKGSLKYQGNKVLGYISSLPAYRSKDTYYITTLDLEAYNSIFKIVVMCVVITLVSIVIPLVGILFYTKKFSYRVIALRKAMSSASTGEYDIIDTLRGDDELTETFFDLKYMIQEIKKKEAQVYEALIKQKELINQQQKMEFKLLASQINPHFIYNTLETIRMLAIENDDYNVSTAIKLLGQAIHYVLENTETFSTTLEKELNYIDVYLQIQKLRFEDRISYSITIQEDIRSREYQILPLLLQPIVENAVTHGLKNVKKNGWIKVEVTSDKESALYITIEDNGIGMDTRELNRLDTKIKEKSDNTRIGIGLNNINQRIRLFYGEEYYMKLESTPENGTKVRLMLPLIPV
ncbi:sensor histidine kinase [Anaerocolumna sp. AGMB13020]|uniref:sensor histidine kinase n=1 Tax=Anaerocolumna sp. AGMB13020 TaxID=3081750 RepID=UPI0029552D0C|nr:sensor histidine kinase [Anaerocolumna sp. AGMB13020]WOO37741.1 sensor histidine kinase [Anaerocolumna sp. AGMB13020]